MGTLFGTVRALLEAHIQECGQRYRRLDEQQQNNHRENQTSIQSLATKLDAVSLQLTTSRVENLLEERKQAISGAKWLINGLCGVIMILVGALGYVIAHGWHGAMG